MNGLKKLSLVLRRAERTRVDSGPAQPRQPELHRYGLFILHPDVKDPKSTELELEVE